MYKKTPKLKTSIPKFKMFWDLINNSKTFSLSFSYHFSSHFLSFLFRVILSMPVFGFHETEIFGIASHSSFYLWYCFPSKFLSLVLHPILVLILSTATTETKLWHTTIKRSLMAFHLNLTVFERVVNGFFNGLNASFLKFFNDLLKHFNKLPSFS